MIAARRPVPMMLLTAIALASGTAAAEYATLPLSLLIVAAWIVTIIVIVRRWNRSSAGPVPLLLCLVILSAARWTMLRNADETSPLGQLATTGNVIARFRATVVSVPTESESTDSVLSGQRDGNEWRTRFVVQCHAVEIDDAWCPLPGLCRTSVSGRAATRCGRGDDIVLTGQLNAPQSPGNPGEFDFATFLRRRHTAGLIFVNHADAIRVERSAGRLSPDYWLTQTRQAAHRIIEGCVSERHRALALALLLGDRSEVRPETKVAFVSSGTMHLLAISGLHIGILCVLLMRICHGLLVPAHRALWVTVVICIVYAFITDLRPSVVRATLFVSLFAFSQSFGRSVSVKSVIGLTAVAMIVWQPHLVFDTGAWLSLLSVIALARAARPPSDLQQRASRLVALTLQDRIADAFAGLRLWLSRSYYPMLWILAATLPLTVREFHVLSPVSLMMNVLLIPVTAVALWLGFASIAFGWLVPTMINLPALAFSVVLEGLMQTVDIAARVGIGHSWLPDLPGWFLPIAYGLLAAAMLLRHEHGRRAMWLGLILLSILGLARSGDVPQRSRLRCTVLDVGHGSSATIELPDGSVILVDAGAMNRGSRAGETISHCLWNRGFRTIDAVVVSHADVDHFNGLDTVFARFPVGQLLVSQKFVHNDAPAVAELLTIAARRGIPIRLVADGETLVRGDVVVDLFQASPERLSNAASDNEKSVVVQVRYGSRTICLPGDLEGEALTDVLPRLSPVDVLVSPHHGSLNANVDEVREHLRPNTLIVSARDADNRSRLRLIYPKSQIHFTSEAGAVTVDVRQSGALSIRGFRDDPR